jgi:hypothetical protein
MLVLPVVVLLALSGGPGPARPAKTVEELWRRLPLTGNACGDALSFDYGAEGGLRNFACRAGTLLSLPSLLRLSPVSSPFLSGPHHGDTLDLNAPNSFGHYDPAFVRWATGALLPASHDSALRAQTQGTYDAQVRTLARIYYRVWRVLSAHQAWATRERDLYLGAMKKGQGDWSGPVVGLYEELLGKADADWGGADPNLVRSATMWWLRRLSDETAPLWADGLLTLLSTYDDAWLRTARREAPPKPPARAKE